MNTFTLWMAYINLLISIPGTWIILRGDFIAPMWYSRCLRIFGIAYILGAIFIDRTILGVGISLFVTGILNSCYTPLTGTILLFTCALFHEIF